MTRRQTIRILGAGAGCALAPGLHGQAKWKGGKKVKQFAPHPGTIRMIDESDGSVRVVKAEDAPERQQFVYLDKDGREVDSAAEAVDRIPVVEVRLAPTDGKGNLVPKDRAELIRIREFGPAGRLLRNTTMTPNKPPVRR